MAYASRSGRARTNASDPRAHAICDRCGFRYNHPDLQWQYEWAGSGLQNLRILVCDRCLDVPQDQLRSIVLPADPLPIINPRPEFFVQDEQGGDFNVDFNSDFSGGGPSVGFPIGIDYRAQMPLVAGQFWAVPVSVLSILSNGSSTVTVNTNGPHGLSTNAQISVQGLSNQEACGAFSILVTNSTQFTYVALSVIPTASLYNAYTRMVTLNVGLPYAQTTIPQIGP